MAFSDGCAPTHGAPTKAPVTVSRPEDAELQSKVPRKRETWWRDPFLSTAEIIAANEKAVRRGVLQCDSRSDTKVREALVPTEVLGNFVHSTKSRFYFERMWMSRVLKHR